MSVFTDIEQKIVITITETKNPDVRGYLLSNTTPNDFGDEHAANGRKRMDALLQQGKTIPDALTFSQDTVFSKGTQLFVGGSPLLREECKDYNLEDAKALVHRLKLARNKRAWEDTLVNVGKTTEGALDEKQLEDIANEVEKTLVVVRDGFNQQPLEHLGARQSEETAKTLLHEIIDQEAAQFVSTGIPELDKRIFGYERGNLVTISAPRGGGKSTMAMCNGIRQYLDRNHNVCFVSMEMTKKEFLRRLVSNISEVPHDSIRSGKYKSKEDLTKVKRTWSRFWHHGQKNNCTFTIWAVSESFFTPMKMEASLAPFMYDVIIIDYITLFHGGKLETWKMQMEYSRYLAQMAKRLQCVVIVITQMNEEEKVKYGRSVEENTDYWLNWRWREEKEAELGKAEVRLQKARHTKPQRLLGDFHLDVMNIQCSALTEQAIVGIEADDNRVKKGGKQEQSTKDAVPAAIITSGDST